MLFQLKITKFDVPLIVIQYCVVEAQVCRLRAFLKISCGDSNVSENDVWITNTKLKTWKMKHLNCFIILNSSSMRHLIECCIWAQFSDTLKLIHSQKCHNLVLHVFALCVYCKHNVIFAEIMLFLKHDRSSDSNVLYPL